MIGLVTILFSINFKISILSITIASIYLIFQMKYGGRIKRLSYNVSKQRGKFQTVSQEIVENSINIRLMN